MSVTACRLCGSDLFATVLCTSGPHYAKKVCHPHNHFIEWVARPREAMASIPDELRPFLIYRAKPIPLQGSERQVSAARSLRFSMTEFANKAGDPEYSMLLSCVRDASWFLANKGLHPPALRCWPRPDQMEPA